MKPHHYTCIKLSIHSRLVHVLLCAVAVGLGTSPAHAYARSSGAPNSTHVQMTPVYCIPGSADVRGIFLTADPIGNVTTIGKEPPFEGSPYPQFGERALRQLRELSQSRVVIAPERDVSDAIPHPLALEGEGNHIAQWLSRRAHHDAQRAAAKLSKAGDDLIPYVFDGSIYPDVLSREILRAWAAYYGSDQSQFHRSINELERGREKLFNSIKVENVLPEQVERRRRQSLALGLVDLHLGMLYGQLDSKAGGSKKAVASFARAIKLLDEKCTPRFNALARIGYLHAGRSSGEVTSEVVLDGARALNLLPVHENRQVFCVASRQLQDLLEIYIGQSSSASTYKATIIKTLDETCS